jgi:hypothetical protein
MTITQTIEIPADHRLVIEVPQEVPAGKTKLEVKLTPVAEVQTDQGSEAPERADERAKRHADVLSRIRSHPTPRADALLGVAANLGDISLEEIRDERLAKYLK